VRYSSIREEVAMPTVLVTSASRGLGREFVRQYAADGWRVLAACRHPEEVDEGLRALGDGVRPIAMDVTDLTSVEAVAREDDAPLDLLLNTAGITGPRDDGPGNVSYPDWARVLDVNTLGPVRVLDAFADRLAAAGGAKALTLTSGMGSIGDVGSGQSMVYRTSKAAVNMAMRARALQLAPRGITVAVINPGWARTDMGGEGASASAEESVAAMRRIIAALTPEQAGSFLNWRGGTFPW
jgi:NAD(P)-dependent dehydrogenase (short-subunit alcohol dehydrogenase family)